jgi:DnaJ-class molecular chaperone
MTMHRHHSSQPRVSRGLSVLCAAASAGLVPLVAEAQFQFEIPQEFFGGGGGGFQQQMPQQRRRSRSGSQIRVPRSIDDKFAWMKGTAWMWNSWREVKFEADGTFDAPTDSCAQRQCKWSADAEKVYIRWGSDGVHWVQPSSNEPKEGNKLTGKREDGQKCSATFLKKEMNDEDLDFYEVLGVEEDMDEKMIGKAIKKSYRDLAKKYHPDKCSGLVDGLETDEEQVDCQTMMNRVNLAYEVLGDEDKRTLYDAGGMDLVKQGIEDGGGPQGGMDPFAALFGGGGRQQRNPNRGADATVSHSVTLEDIYNGNELEMSINRRIVCRGCSGEKGKLKAKCQSCGKCPDETRMVQRQMGPGMIVQQEERVPSKEKCKVEDTVLKTTVERGIADGAEIKFPRKSEQKPGQVPGDVVMTLKQKKHRTFTRDKDDLHMSLEISLKEALLGFEKTYKHLDGHEFEVVKTGVTKPMSVKKIRGEGMPQHGTPSEFGDLHVKFTVVMPTSITPEQAKVIETLF